MDTAGHSRGNGDESADDAAAFGRGDGGADNKADKELNRLDGLARTGTYLSALVLWYFNVTLPIQLIPLVPSSHTFSQPTHSLYD